LQERLARFKQFDVRVVEAGKSGAADERTETRLSVRSTALSMSRPRALAAPS
jgi:hypothetical protein